MAKLLCVLAIVAATLGSARADSYPAKPITFILPFGPGSATDTLTRVVAQYLGPALRQPIVIEPRPGANGALAAVQVARATPDGHTLMMTSNSPHSAVPFLMKNPGYDAVRDFTAITRMGSYTLMLCIHPDIPATSVKELAAYGRANPGKLSFASGNTAGIILGETFKQWGKIDMLHVPYKSTPQALQDVLGGRISMMFVDLTSGLPHVQAGKLRALATTRLKRSALLPGLPTLDEAGIAGFDMDAWAGIMGPARMPGDVVTLLNAELRKIINNPEVKSKLGNVGFEAFSSTPQELEDFIKVQLGKWAKMVKDAGIQPE